MNTNHKQKYHDYWDHCETKGTRDCLNYYINTPKLLAAEINKIKSDFPKTESVDLLIALVGFSWDPIILSICYHKPKQIMPIYNINYGDKLANDIHDDFHFILGLLVQNNFIDELPQIVPDDPQNKAIKDKPQAIFQYFMQYALTEINSDKNSNIIIDITTAKKSMIVGAYLFASYSNTKVSYIDFTDYAEKKGRPYGYSCFPTLLDNPRELFRLKDWELVNYYYKYYQFDNAIYNLDRIESALKNNGYLNDNEQADIQRLRFILFLLSKWEEGDYNQAFQLLKQIKEPNDTESIWKNNKYSEDICNNLPSAIAYIGDQWPDSEDLFAGKMKTIESQKNLAESIYNNNELLVSYGWDELEKIDRLINKKEEFRSALLRAAGLMDVFLRARIIKLYLKERLHISWITDFENRKELKQDEFEISKIKNLINRKFAETSSFRNVFRCLWNEKELKLFFNKSDYDTLNAISADYNAYHGLSITIKGNNISPDGWTNFLLNVSDADEEIRKFAELRNKSIHFCLTIPKPSSEKVYNIVRKNIESYTKDVNLSDFKSHLVTTAFDFDKLIDKLNIKFIIKS